MPPALPDLYPDLPFRPAGSLGSVNLTDKGLLIGSRAILLRMGKNTDGRPRFALEADKMRLLALMSVADGRPVSEHQVVPALDAAAAHWHRGDKALANLRLIFAGLPRLRTHMDADNVFLAESLLEAGMTPHTLMRSLWPDTATVSLDKYSVDEPRVPAGHADGGQWTFGSDGESRPPVDQRPIVVAGPALPPGEGDKEYEERRRTGQTTIEEDAAAKRPLDPTSPLPMGIGPGPFAGQSVPAGPSARPGILQRLEVNARGQQTGCHTCGTKDPGTKSGMFVPDHQFPNALNSPGTDQVYFPHCARCSASQGGLIAQYKRRMGQ